MTIFATAGLGPAQLLKMTLSMAFFVAIAVSILTFWVDPHVLGCRNHLMEKAGKMDLIHTLKPGHFRTLQKGHSVFYLKSINDDKTEVQVWKK